MRLLFKLSILIFPLFLTAQNASINKEISAEILIQKIIDHTKTNPVPNTVDIIKEGDPQTRITGIVTCMFATMEVLKKAMEKDCNLIIAHEPLYYNHLDKTEKFKSDPVFLEKQKFINDNKLVVWRFHDYIHRIQPDGIISGMIEKLGWESNKVKDNPYKFAFPQITLLELVESIKKTFPNNAFQIVGDPSMKISNVMYVPGASGTDTQIKVLRDKDVQVVVAGEVPQWETYEYVRDAVSQNRDKAIIFIGHINSEEAGMKFAADWMEEFITDVPVHFIECGSSYWSH